MMGHYVYLNQRNNHVLYIQKNRCLIKPNFIHV